LWRSRPGSRARRSSPRLDACADNRHSQARRARPRPPQAKRGAPDLAPFFYPHRPSHSSGLIRSNRTVVWRDRFRSRNVTLDEDRAEGSDQDQITTLNARVAMRPRYDNFIGGKWVAPVDGQYFENISPITGKAVCQIARSQAADIELALDAAHKAKD